MKIMLMTLFLGFSCVAMADLLAGDKAPLFTAKTHKGADFNLASQKGRWTVLYFYPKAETPGCTKQACAFRDSINKITELKADIYGVSTDNVAAQEAFHKKHNLNFTLLADPDAKVTELYGSKMPVMKMSKRWTFIIDPDLVIRSVNKDVDPAKDSEQVAKTISDLQKIKK